MNSTVIDPDGQATVAREETIPKTRALCFLQSLPLKALLVRANSTGFDPIVRQRIPSPFVAFPQPIPIDNGISLEKLPMTRQTETTSS